jgi:phage-related minor tail protein
MLASGGPAEAGRSYVVGERGPEIFRPSSSGTVSPNAGGGNTTHNWGAEAITIQVNGVGKNGQDISKQIAASLRTEMRQRGIPSGG